MSDQIFMFFQKVLPKKLLTEFLGKLAEIKGGKLTTYFISYFIKRYGVNMAEAVYKEPSFYKTFNDFFTRAIKPELRPIANATLVSPVDGAISQVGKINNNQIFQAKGKSFTTTALVGGNADLAQHFQNGLFATLYLSPKDYHRIHMPCAGRLRSMTYVPGDLYSVNPLTARSIDQLFARNERVVCLFDSDDGQPFVMVLVGATVVGSMATTWHGVINSPRLGKVHEWKYDGDLRLEKGEEMGRFLLGSTVVMLFPNRDYQLDQTWQPEAAIKMGQPMAVLRSSFSK